MSLNTRLALVALVALGLAPLWLPLLPFVWIWRRADRRRGRSAGFQALGWQQARTLAAHAEATMPQPPSSSFDDVARAADAYLAAVDSPRHWRTMLLVTMLEFAPLLRGHRPLSRLPVAARRQFLERYMTTTGGLLGIAALARQLVRMGYYTLPDVAAALGFQTMGERALARRSQPRAKTPPAPASQKVAG